MYVVPNHEICSVYKVSQRNENLNKFSFDSVVSTNYKPALQVIRRLNNCILLVVDRSKTSACWVEEQVIGQINIVTRVSAAPRNHAFVMLSHGAKTFLERHSES